MNRATSKNCCSFFLRCVSSFRLRWIISLEWLKIEKSDVWISNYSVFLSDLSDLSPMLERLYKQVEQPSCSERKSAPITDHRSLPTNHRIIEEHQVEQARIFKRKRRVSTLNSRSSAFVTEQRFSDRIFCAQSIIFYQFSILKKCSIMCEVLYSEMKKRQLTRFLKNSVADVFV